MQVLTAALRDIHCYLSMALLTPLRQAGVQVNHGGPTKLGGHISLLPYVAVAPNYKHNFDTVFTVT